MGRICFVVYESLLITALWRPGFTFNLSLVPGISQSFLNVLKSRTMRASKKPERTQLGNKWIWRPDLFSAIVW